MKPTLLIIALLILTFSTTNSAQNVVRLFDAVPITQSSTESRTVYRTTQLFLNCPTDFTAQGILSGPNGDFLIADNLVEVDGLNICPGNCFQFFVNNPADFLGQPIEFAYFGVPPIDAGDLLFGARVYRFDLVDHGEFFGNNEIYLNTNCSLDAPPPPPAPNQVCHRSNGRAPGRTLTLPPNAIAAHLRHGDTAGACAE